MFEGNYTYGMDLVWKSFYYWDVFGRSLIYQRPYLPNDSSNLLLLQITQMPKKRPLSMEAACMLASQEYGKLYLIEQKKFLESLGAEDPRFTNFFNQWVNWISEQGYHIELTGDEFESRPCGAA